MVLHITPTQKPTQETEHFMLTRLFIHLRIIHRRRSRSPQRDLQLVCCLSLRSGWNGASRSSQIREYMPIYTGRVGRHWCHFQGKYLELMQRITHKSRSPHTSDLPSSYAEMLCDEQRTQEVECCVFLLFFKVQLPTLVIKNVNYYHLYRQ